MQSRETNVIFFIGDRVRDIRTNIKGTVYGLKALGMDGIKIKFDNRIKKIFFGIQHEYLEKI